MDAQPAHGCRRFLGALLIAASTLAPASDLSTTPVPAAAVQELVHGMVREAVRFREGEQTLTLVLSETGRHGDGDAGESARLYATLFETGENGDFRQRWRLSDWVIDCPLDLTLAYTQPAHHLRDADRDGLIEVWVSYRLACRGDVSPTALKLIGYEGTQKLAMRGSSTLVYQFDGQSHTESGPPPEVDAALARQPALHAEAERIWQTIARESLGD